jgi:hypothetical protein
MALFGSEMLFTIRDENEILRTLGSRPHWSQVRPDVLRALIRNAGDDMLKISRFVFVSEYFDCVEHNFVDLSGIWEDPRMALSAFAATLVGVASDTIKHLGEVPAGSEQLGQAMIMVEISFLSALLCDPYMLTAVRGLASFYQATGKLDNARGMCRKFDETERALLAAKDDYTTQYRKTKYQPAAAALRAEIDRLKTQLGPAR